MMDEFPDEQEKNKMEKISGGTIIGVIDGTVPVVQIHLPNTNLEQQKAVLEVLEQEDFVFYAGIEHPVRLSAMKPGSFGIDNMNEPVPNGEDWYLEATNMYPVWDYIYQQTNLNHPLTGILDSGFKLDHPGLSGRIQMSEHFSANTESLHGTAVASLIAADDEVYKGMDPEGQLLGIDAGKIHFSTEYLLALNALAGEGCKVINISRGYYLSDERHWKEAIKDDPDFAGVKSYEAYKSRTRSLIQPSVNDSYLFGASMYQREKKGWLIVEAAGNGYNNSYSEGIGADYSGLFAGCPDSATEQTMIDEFGVDSKTISQHVIVVGSLADQKFRNGKGTFFTGSNYGPTVDICAPGENLTTANLDDKYSACSTTDCGTSYAAPQVAGLASILWSVDPSLTGDEVKKLIVEEPSRRAVRQDKNGGIEEYPVMDGWASLSTLLQKTGQENPRTIKDGFYNGNCNDIQIGLVKNSEWGGDGIDIVMGGQLDKHSDEDFHFTYYPGKIDYYISSNRYQCPYHIRFHEVSPDEIKLLIQCEDGSADEQLSFPELVTLKREDLGSKQSETTSDDTGTDDTSSMEENDNYAEEPTESDSVGIEKARQVLIDMGCDNGIGGDGIYSPDDPPAMISSFTFHDDGSLTYRTIRQQLSQESFSTTWQIREDLMAPGDTADWPARLIVEASELNIDGTVYQNVILKLDIQPGADYLRIEDGVNIDILRVSSDSLPATCLQTAGYIGNL
ncbi:S8 family peptidase [Faecalibaculum rodentium]|nr:S8/S53 family peptidase [Faecalibaculum rodentium]